MQFWLSASFHLLFPPRPGERINCPPFPQHVLHGLVPRGAPDTPLLPAGEFYYYFFMSLTSLFLEDTAGNTEGQRAQC